MFKSNAEGERWSYFYVVVVFCLMGGIVLGVGEAGETDVLGTELRMFTEK
jgi:hypothetical protein